MKTWKEIITEAESRIQKQRRIEVEKLADTDPDFEGSKRLQSKGNRTKYIEKKKSDYQDYLDRQLAFKTQKYEDQKKAQIERLKNKGVEQHAAATKASLSGIKTQQISSQDKEGTAYSKAIGNVGSAAAGVAGAAINRLKQARAQAKANAEAKAAKEAQPEKKEPGAPGRPPRPKTTAPASTPKTTTSTALATRPAPPMAANKRKMLPASSQGGTRVGQPAPRPALPGQGMYQKKLSPTKTIGQPAPQRPALPMAVDKRKMLPASSQGGTRVGQSATGTRPQLPGSQKRKAIQAGTYKPIKSVNEKYSNWREEFLFEIDDFGLKDNKKEKGKKKIIDVMKGTNKIEINPNETSVKEEVSGVDTQQNPNQANNLEKKQKAIQRQILMKKIQSLSVPGPTDITASYDPRIEEAYKDEEGGMSRNELSTVERAIKSLRKKIKSNNQQLPAWVQSKITKAADYIDTAADYMSGETEQVNEAYDDDNETFRQHSRERFTAGPADDDKAQRTSRILQRMKEMNKDAEPKKKKKKKKIKLEEEGPVLSVGRGEKLSVERGGGLTQKGRDKYNRATGSNLQAPVTGDVKPGSKAAQRRKNFCSRSRSWKGERGLAARRRWKC